MNIPQKPVRIHKTDKSNGNFTQISNEIINNPNLTMKAKGIMLYVLSKPSDWKVNIADIENHCKENERAIRAGIKELIDQGYMKRYPVREGNRIKEWMIETFENGIASMNSLDCGFVDVQCEDVQNSHYSNKELKKDLLINNIKPQKEETAEQKTTAYLKANFPENIQAMLLSVKFNHKTTLFDIPFLQAFKTAYKKTADLEHSEALLKRELLNTLEYMQNNRVDDLPAFMISKIKKLPKFTILEKRSV